MGFGGALLALSAVKGIASIGQGFAQGAEDKYNASLATQEAQLTQVQGDITQGQYTRQAGQLLSTQTADIAAKGLQPSGSAAAVMLDSQTQIQTDMAIAKFNTQMGVNQSNARATALKQQASQSVYSGFSSAFSDLLTGATQYGMYKNKINLNAGAS
jgi:hypothetical protein